MKTPTNKSGILSFTLIFIMILLIIGISCSNKPNTGDEELSKMQEENKKLQIENEALRKEIDGLKTTPDFVYREGIDLLSNNDFEGARVKFTEVLDKYPNSEYDNQAKNRIKEVDRELARIEAEKKKAEKEAEEARKYEPRTDAEAIFEWVDFRNNEDKRKGTITTWRFKVAYLGVDGVTGQPIAVGYLGPSKSVGCRYGSDDVVKGSKKIKEGDWITVTGAFASVDSEGIVFIRPEKIVNEGYSD